MNVKPIVCIYHANCMDGFASAWVLHDHLRHREHMVTFIAATYGDAPPLEECRDAIVYIVDFSYSPIELNEIAAAASWVYLLDHHKSAIEKIKAFREAGKVFRPNIDFTLDMTMSGVGIIWTTLYGSMPMPKILASVQDRDLWKFELTGTKEYSAALHSYAYDFPTFDYLMKDVTNQHLFNEGRTLLRQEAKEVSIIVANAFLCNFEGFTDIPIACCPPWLASEVGNILCQGKPFSMTFFEYEHEIRYSLRSQKEGGEDVSLIAAVHGGGGHKNAAGFVMKQLAEAQLDFNFLLTQTND